MMNEQILRDIVWQQGAWFTILNASAIAVFIYRLHKQHADIKKHIEQSSNELLKDTVVRINSAHLKMHTDTRQHFTDVVKGILKDDFEKLAKQVGARRAIDHVANVSELNLIQGELDSKDILFDERDKGRLERDRDLLKERTRDFKHSVDKAEAMKGRYPQSPISTSEAELTTSRYHSAPRRRVRDGFPVIRPKNPDLVAVVEELSVDITGVHWYLITMANDTEYNNLATIVRGADLKIRYDTARKKSIVNQDAIPLIEQYYRVVRLEKEKEQKVDKPTIHYKDWKEFKGRPEGKLKTIFANEETVKDMLAIVGQLYRLDNSDNLVVDKNMFNKLSEHYNFVKV